MFDINKNDYYFSLHVGTSSLYNFMLLASKDDKEYKIQARLRRIVDDKIFDSNDVKKFFSFNCPLELGDEHIIQKGKEAMEYTKSAFNFDEIREIEINGDSEKFFEKLKEHPDIFHMKKVSKEEGEEIIKEDKWRKFNSRMNRSNN